MLSCLAVSCCCDTLVSTIEESCCSDVDEAPLLVTCRSVVDPEDVVVWFWASVSCGLCMKVDAERILLVGMLLVWIRLMVLCIVRMIVLRCRRLSLNVWRSLVLLVGVLLIVLIRCLLIRPLVSSLTWDVRSRGGVMSGLRLWRIWSVMLGICRLLR